MKKVLKHIQEGIFEVLFPHICLLCGLKLSANQKHLCSECLKNRFELANPDYRQVCSDTLLPEGIIAQHALWKFDKGGHLQELMHLLKYGHLTGIGIDLGRVLGDSMKGNSYLSDFFSTATVLVPVPLHVSKKKKRGYNQAQLVCQGIALVTHIQPVDEEVVVRLKKTRTQTGFNREKRRANLQGAFSINRPELIAGLNCIIVDDVFTTGATTFELAKVLKDHKAGKICIVTVAQA